MAFNAKSIPKKEVSLLEVILENVGLGPWNYLIFAAASIGKFCYLRTKKNVWFYYLFLYIFITLES